MMRYAGYTLFVAVLLLSAGRLSAQQTVADDALTPEQFTEILKEEWANLRQETEAFLEVTRARNEFETTPEFEARVAQERRVYLSKISKRIKDQKFDTRIFGVLLKAQPVTYNADKREYALRCSVAVEAPYTIPTILTYVPSNNFVRVQDTIVGGYRTSRLMLKFRPYFMWKVDRPVAIEARDQERYLYFRLRCTLDITQPNLKEQALLRVIPREIQLVNAETNSVFWREEIR